MCRHGLVTFFRIFFKKYLIQLSAIYKKKSNFKPTISFVSYDFLKLTFMIKYKPPHLIQCPVFHMLCSVANIHKMVTKWAEKYKLVSFSKFDEFGQFLQFKYY